ncbi:hypothetical protein ABL78_0138 [Leptomonas seymouri]|uniref:Uncharacterized protein n=1 Tax=Leptomonas seymouri TaxID=5684 RepID=A0A0N1IAN8_LEPSE|nr:hypothetical protein ABL78_0138 [Leptomonas seymouri]|eukprot:KPI90702.1 hypothetical protein ABL78_0138 [Leptomonas seymouri]
MRGRRLLAQGAAAAPCSSPWLSTSTDLAASIASVKIEGVPAASEAQGSLRLLGCWSCSIAAYWWLIASSRCLKGDSYVAARSAPKQVSFYTHAASRQSNAAFLRRSLAVSLQQTSGPAPPRHYYMSLGTALDVVSAVRAFHTTSSCHADVSAHGASSTQHTKDTEEISNVTYDKERHIENANALLRETYGPQAKLVLHRLTQRHKQVTAVAKHAEASDCKDAFGAAAQPTAAGGTEHAQDYYFRASATFRFLGFAVELAVANGLRPRETIESCLQQALASDITFIRPGNHSGNNPSTNSVQRNGGGGGGGGGVGGGRTEEDIFDPQHRRPLKKARGKQNHHSSQNNGHDNGKAWSTQRSESMMLTSHAARLTPHQLELKAIMDDLRQLCIHFSRSVKFSVKPPYAGGRRKTAATTEEQKTSGVTKGNEDTQRDGAMTDKQWRCRCYVKEEWSTIAQAHLAHEVLGSSPNDAFVRCVTQLRQRYKEELESPAVLEEGVREVVGMVQLQHKTVAATYSAEPASHSLSSSPATTSAPAPSPASSSLVEMPTYRAHVDVTDAHGNTTSYTARQKASPYMAYEAAAWLALRAETLWDRETHLLSEGLPVPPLLWRMRWQFDLLLDHICRETGRAPEEVAWIQLTGNDQQHKAQHQHSGSVHKDADSSSSGNLVASDIADKLGPSPGGVISGMIVPPVPLRFTGSLYSERDVLVWQTSGGGRYRVEFDTYVQALYHLLDQYADCLPTLPCMARGVGESLLFPNASVLELHVHRHNAFPVLQHHHGNLNCYALLGTLTSQLLGCPYSTHYHYDMATSEYTATLTVNDGRVTNQPLIQRRSKKKGEAWRFACLDAMKENFPQQYAAILDRYPEVDLSAEDVARSAHLRALPRVKRIPYFPNLSVMVMAFAEEDLGWRQPRVRLRNLANNIGLPQWSAELEAQVEGEEGRRVVAVSASFPQMQAARRSLIYRMAKQYFPDELAAYKSLKRSDIVDPELEEVTRVNKFYTPNAAVNSSTVSHVLALMEGRHQASAPMHFTLEARVQGAANEESTEAEMVETRSIAAESSLGLPDMRYVEGDTVMLYTQEPAAILRPPRIAYTARVLGNRGDVLIADFDSDSATTTADAQAVPVLVTALKSASFHLAGGDAETLWTEYETHPLPASTTTRGLAVALFNQFFGSAACRETAAPASARAASTNTSSSIPAASPSVRVTPAGKGDAEGEATVEVNDMDPLSLSNFDASITVLTTKVGEYWFGTAVLPRLGMLPIARAVASSKRKCISDALIAAARHSFPRILHYAVKHDVTSAAIAATILTEPIVEHLPPSVCRDLLDQLERKKKLKPLPPFQLLVKCTTEAYPRRERFIRVQQTHDTSHGFQYRLYLQRCRAVRPGDTQLVGYGASVTSAPAALYRASVMALDNLYEPALWSAIAAQPNYREPPAES